MKFYLLMGACVLALSAGTASAETYSASGVNAGTQAGASVQAAPTLNTNTGVRIGSGADGQPARINADIDANAGANANITPNAGATADQDTTADSQARVEMDNSVRTRPVDNESGNWWDRLTSSSAQANSGAKVKVYND